MSRRAKIRSAVSSAPPSIHAACRTLLPASMLTRPRPSLPVGIVSADFFADKHTRFYRRKRSDACRRRACLFGRAQPSPSINIDDFARAMIAGGVAGVNEIASPRRKFDLERPCCRRFSSPRRPSQSAHSRAFQCNSRPLPTTSAMPIRYSVTLTCPSGTGLPFWSSRASAATCCVSVSSMPRAASPFGRRKPTYRSYGLYDSVKRSVLNVPLSSKRGQEIRVQQAGRAACGFND